MGWHPGKGGPPEPAKDSLGVEVQGCRRRGVAEAGAGGEGRKSGGRRLRHLTATTLGGCRSGEAGRTGAQLRAAGGGGRPAVLRGRGGAATAARGSRRLRKNKKRPRDRVKAGARHPGRRSPTARTGQSSRPQQMRGLRRPEHQSNSANRPQPTATSGRPPRVRPQGRAGAKDGPRPARSLPPHARPGRPRANGPPPTNDPKWPASSAHSTDG